MADERTQLTAADLDGMTPEAIAAAHAAGRFDVALGMPPADAAVIRRAAAGEPVTLEDVATLARLGRHDLVNEAHRDNRIAAPKETNQ